MTMRVEQLLCLAALLGLSALAPASTGAAAQGGRGGAPTETGFGLPPSPEPPAEEIRALLDQARREASEAREQVAREDREAASRAENAARKQNYEFPVLKTQRVYVNVPELVVTTGLERVYINVPRIDGSERRIPYNVHDVGLEDAVEWINVPCVEMHYRRFPWGGGMHVPGVTTCRERIVRPKVVVRTRTEYAVVHVPTVTTERASFDFPTFSAQWRTRRGFFDAPRIEAPSNVEEKQEAQRQAEARANDYGARLYAAERMVTDRLDGQTRRLLQDYIVRVEAWSAAATTAVAAWHVREERKIAEAERRLMALQAAHAGLDISGPAGELGAARSQLEDYRQRILERVSEQVRRAREWADNVATRPAADAQGASGPS